MQPVKLSLKASQTALRLRPAEVWTAEENKHKICVRLRANPQSGVVSEVSRQKLGRKISRIRVIRL